MKNSVLNGYVYDVLAHYDSIDDDDTVNISKY